MSSVSLIYIFGLIWLGSILGWDKPIFDLGAKPFLLAELFKILLLSVLLVKFKIIENYANYLGDLLEGNCRVLLCILRRLAVSETFLLHNSNTLWMCSHFTLSADIGFSGGLALESGKASKADSQHRRHLPV